MLVADERSLARVSAVADEDGDMLTGAARQSNAGRVDGIVGRDPVGRRARARQRGAREQERERNGGPARTRDQLASGVPGATRVRAMISDAT